MPDTFLWDVFLSHSSRDKLRVRQLAEGLRDAGLRVWFDEWAIQPGDDIYAAIENGLEYARSLILCMSQAAIESDWVKLERNTAIFRDPQNKGRSFIPLLLEDCRPPAVISRIAYMDWRNGGAEALAKLIQLCQPLNQKAKVKTRRGRAGITPPTGTMSSENPLYIKREADAYAMLAAQQVAETVVIKAPRQMGKSSLLISYLGACQRNGKKTVLIDLASLFTDEDLVDYPRFLTLLAQEMWEQLGRAPQAAPPRLSSQREMIKYLERSLLKAVDGVVVIAFDETDRLLGRAYQSDFFSMLRSWHNQRADLSTNWAKLGLALVISTEPYLFIKDAMRSPFNVGLNIELRYFNEAEYRKLNRLYGARLTEAELGQLMALLNGHPHLTHLAFYALTGPNPMGYAALSLMAAERDGPFGVHLRALENKLVDDVGQRLLATMNQIINDGKASSKDDFYRLYGAGLVRRDGARILPTNQIYARFFSKL
jgi:AAA domain-containing protein/TIR domain-containing protein